MFTRIADFISQIFRRSHTETGWEHDEQDSRPTEKKPLKKPRIARPTRLRPN